MSPALLLPFLAGCGSGSSLTTGPTSAALTGNWQFAASSAPASASQVAALSGSLQVVDASSSALPSTVRGVVHTVALPSQRAASLCVPSSEAIAVTGSTAKDGTLTLTSASFGSGSVLTVRGTFDAATRTLGNAQFGIAGGSCGVAMQPMIATQYKPINGIYTGTFTSVSGSAVAVSAQLTQTSSADANGSFSLSGTGTFGQSACLSSPVVTSSTVSGNSVAWTYTDPGTGAQVDASGSFDSTATTLTIATYTLSGGPAGCSDTGSGSLVKH